MQPQSIADLAKAVNNWLKGNDSDQSKSCFTPLDWPTPFERQLLPKRVTIQLLAALLEEHSGRWRRWYRLMSGPPPSTWRCW